MKNYKELLKSYENLNKFNNKEREIKDNYFKRNLSDKEFKEQINEIDTKHKKERIKKEILKNNIAIEIKKLFINEIFEDLQKYNTKNIGEKTKDKIEKDIKALIKERFDINISCYYSTTNYISSYSIEFRFYLLNDTNFYLYGDNKAIIEINLYFKNGEKVDFNREKLENPDNIKKIIKENEKTIELKDIKKQVNKIYNNRIKLDKKVEECRKALEKMSEEFKQDLYNNLYDIDFLTKTKQITIY